MNRRQRAMSPAGRPLATPFQFRDVFAQQDAIVDGLVVTLQLSGGSLCLSALGILVATVLVDGRPGHFPSAGYVR
ncbi:MAG: hypothetical protein IPI73_04055 [Betaproteobacteria bacterium]|nr:hypothetical protein [Betaproteobacteria bacterium]